MNSSTKINVRGFLNNASLPTIWAIDGTILAICVVATWFTSRWFDFTPSGTIPLGLGIALLSISEFIFVVWLAKILFGDD